MQDQDPTDPIETLAREAKLASHVLGAVSSRAKNAALQRIRTALEDRREAILAANALDLKAAKEQVAAGTMSTAMFARLNLAGPGGDKYDSLLAGVSDVALLPDPTNQVTLARKVDHDLELYRVTCPVGVCLIIFEARPEVVVQISCLAIKSGNAAILKGGKEAQHSNQALFDAIQTALRVPAGEGEGEGGGPRVPPNAVSLVATRSEIQSLLQLDKYIDLCIPRGSKALVQHVQGATRIPVLGHADGICHVYVDASADPTKASRIVFDSKTHYPAACNAAETLLVHKDAVTSILPKIAEALEKVPVRLHCDAKSLAFLSNLGPRAPSRLVPLQPGDYDTEWLSMDMSLRIVDSLDEAISHINTHGSRHTDCIVTETKAHADKFMQRVDAAGVYWNASTRFADGFRYGFGAEIGVSTNKTHARGPVGLEGLVLYRYRLFSASAAGSIAADYGEGASQRPYLHEDIPLSNVLDKFQL